MFRRVAHVDDVPEGGRVRVEIDGRAVVVFRIDGELFALDDDCPHRGGSLCEGELYEGEITCPAHGAIFDVRTGEALGPPAEEDVAVHPVRRRGDDVEVDV